MADLRAIDRKRLDGLQENTMQNVQGDDIWYIHTVLAQCFLPYRDPDSRDWDRKNGKISICLTAGKVRDPDSETGSRIVGLPFGAKPRLFMTYVNTQAVKNRSPVIPVERSMTAMIKELGLNPSGGKRGTITSFKEQVTKLAACNFRIIAPDSKSGVYSHVNAEPFKRFDVWFAPNAEQQTLWPSEIILSTEFYDNLVEHAVPYDMRGLRLIQSNARAQDIYLWMTQRLCRIPRDKPLFMTWDMLREMFGGQMTDVRHFPREFKKALLAARTAYPDSKIEEEDNGFRFLHSPPPIPKTRLTM